MSNSISKNVAAKVLDMIKNVGDIPRNGTNPKFNYKFVKETDVADKLRAACMKVGLVIIPSVHSVARDTVKTAAGNDQYRTTLMLKLTLIDPSSGESIEMDIPGEALDSQDKAVPKAITSAYKYGLLKLAMNGGGDDDDTEHESNEPKDTKSKETHQKPIPPGATYRKPDEAPTDAPLTTPPAQIAPPPPATQPAARAASAPPVDKPMSVQTVPDQVKPEPPVESVVTAEMVGTITAVIPAMRGKPATITLKPKDGSPALAASFDPKNLPVVELLKFQNAKSAVMATLDVTSDPPYLMHVQAVQEAYSNSRSVKLM